MVAPYALDFSPVANALEQNRQYDLSLKQQEMAQNRLALEQGRFGFEKELQPFKVQQAKTQVSSGQLENMGARSRLLGGVGQALRAETDPAKKQAYVKQMISTIPDMKDDLDKVLPPGWDANPDLVGHYVTHLARGYRDPTQEATAQANLATTQEALRQAKVINPIAEEEAQVKLKKLRAGEPLDELISGVARRIGQSQQSAPGQTQTQTPPSQPSYGAPSTVPPTGAQPMPGITVQPPATMQKMGDVGDGVDVAFCVVGQAGAGHQGQVVEYGMQAFADAGVQVS